MATRKLDKAGWADYFDTVSRTLGTKVVSVEIASLAIGDQHAIDAATLTGLSYDPHSDSVEILMRGLDHRIGKPAEIYVDESTLGLESVEIVESDGSKQIVKLTEPLLLTSHSTENLEGHVHGLVEAAKTQRDELRVRLHLLRSEMRDEWENVERKWQELEPRLEQLEKGTRAAAGDVSSAARRLAEEITDAYRRLKRSLE